MDLRRLRSMMICLALLSSATSRAEAPSNTSLPPLIPREVFFGDPDIVAPQLSPDGKQIAFIRPFHGTRNIWVKKTYESFDKAHPITAETARPVGGYFWSRDAKYVLYVRDNGGDENFNVYAVDPAAKPAKGSEVPPARNLTNTPSARTVIYAVPKSAPDVIYIGLNDRDPAWHDVYKLKLSTGEKELVLKNTDRFTGVYFDLTDKLRLVSRSANNGDTEILSVDSGTPKKIYSCSLFESCAPGRFHKDGKHVYLSTNRGAENNFVRLALLDVTTGNESLVESDPENKVDLLSPIFSEKTDELIATAYQGDEHVRLYWRDEDQHKRYEYVKSQLPGMDISWASVTPDERLALVMGRSDTEPGEVYLYDYATIKISFQFRIREELPRKALAHMQSIRYASSDGLEIPAYLTLPVGLEAKSLPLIVIPHGGPWARDTWGYNPLAQFFANRGFAVLSPNFRASVGYGKKFLDAGDQQWGDKMQDDLTWGVKHLVDRGIADPKRVAIFGGSYGGYATLAGVAFTPDVYAAAVALVGPSNLVTLLNSIPPYWEAGRKVFNQRLGDPTTPEGRAKLERQSPLNSADKIKTPLMIIQGANDPRVKRAESEQIVIALRDRNFPVEYLLAQDEGHGFARPENNIAAFAAIEHFFAKHVPGIRYQEELSPETRAQLQKLVVDPRTVKLDAAIPLTETDVAKVAGDWEGTLKPAPTMTLRLALHVAGDAHKGLQVTMDSLDQNAKGLPVEGVKISGDTFKFEMPQIAGRFEGKFDASGNSISGTWSQGPGNLPLTWTRTLKK